MSNNEQEARFEAIIGATGSGKTTKFRKRFNKIPKASRGRVLCWSPKEVKDKYAEFFPGATVCLTIAEVLAVVSKAGPRGRFAVVFVPTLSRKADEAQFNVFCQIALKLENLVFVVDELHTVTTPTWAVDGWVKLNFMGRAFGVWVFGMSQRPASVDKAFLGSLSFVSCARLSYDDDRKTMARTVGVPVAELAALVGYQSIERNMLTGEIARNL